ncbi:MAG: 50S ribosomal protein L23 [Bacteroidia bacterium]|nr:50S ribosomal protein L23 [Bacteroidia bacterium]
MILKKPLITEKMTAIMEKRGQFGFVVDKNATKDEIKKAIEDFYKVEVATVNTMIARGKSRRNRRTGQISGYTNAYKKAIITLKEGFNIDFYENI